MELTQVRLLVTDFPLVYRFYRDVLQLKPQVDDERGPYAKLSFDEGTCAIALHAREDFAKTFPDLAPAGGDRALVVLKVPDIEAAVASIAQRGGRIAGGPVEAWGRLRLAYVRDPEGNLVELQQWLATRG